MEYFRLGICNCGCGRRIDVIRAKRRYLIKYLNGHNQPKVKYSCGKCRDQSWIIECKCGCGETLSKRNRFYEIREFSFGHAIRIREQNGQKNIMWKGGRSFKKDVGYWTILVPNHPYATTNGRCPAHRLVYEQYLSIIFDEDVYLPRELVVHHINENKEDNSLINLQLMNRSDHTVLHNVIDMTVRTCSNPECVNSNGYEHRKWLSDSKGGYVCNRCYNKIKRKNKK